MIKQDGDTYTLAVPLLEAVTFSLGWDDHGYIDPPVFLRQLVGALAVDSLEYQEQWKIAGVLKEALEDKWVES
ncbi:MAG: hypothetical protein ABI883_02500 [Chthoniobacterales bacterium]